ncbi:MAG: UDP-2,3-diacylglucosamine diphosphatase LpxI [Candidatus Omnitrophica bacterium]|nr:UDP-2,3-diacylglucosamine diphosphatase LpxI [Candidatus Omnitrophota bacterium]
MDKIGIIAGSRKFPLLLAQKAREQGLGVVAIAIKGDTSRSIKEFADKVEWIKIGDFKRIASIFKKHDVVNVAMVGQINPLRLFDRRLRANKDVTALLESVKDKRADSIFGAIAQMLSADGLKVLDSTLFLKDFLPKKGVLTSREPDFKQWQDIYFGAELARELAFLDIGQSIAVKDKAVVAAEALEGTDALIRRAGLITRGGAVVVKVSKPKQDMRFDIPVVGLNTVKNLISSRAGCLAIEAGKTLFIDMDASLKLANSKKLIIVAI